MYPIIGQCPVCGGELAVTRLHCDTCSTTIAGRFLLGRLARLSPEQIAFVETFVACEGKLNRVGEMLDVSYPKVRAQLDDVILSLGYSVDKDLDESENALKGVSEEERKRILDALAQGQITSEVAAKRLRGEEVDDV